MSIKQPHSDEGTSEALERRLRMTNQRYQIFFKIAGDIVNRVVEDRSDGDDTFYSTHSVHISDFISIDEVDRLIQFNELRDIESWADHMEELREEEADDLRFDDWPEVNVIFETVEDARDSVAQVLALNDSFSGFIALLVSWIESEDDYRRLASLSQEHGYDETDLQMKLVEVLTEEVPELPEVDLLSAAIFIIQMVEQEEA